MSDPGRVRSRVRALLEDGSAAGSVLERLCVGAVSVLPVDGAAISVLTGAAGLGCVGASDAASGQLDDLQCTLGEGPCWDALRGGRPVLMADLTGSTAAHRWPMYSAEALRAGFRAIFAFPLQIGAIKLGTLGLMRAGPGPLEGAPLADALIVMDVAVLTLVGSPAGDPPAVADPEPDVSWLYRAEIHQATGMVMAQLGVSAQEALVRLRAHAYARGRTADEIAREIVARRLRLARDLP